MPEPVLLGDVARHIVERLDRLRAVRAAFPAYVLDVGPRGAVRAYRLDQGRRVEPLEAVMDLDDELADVRQREAREAAVSRLWARDRWGR
jgi:hypothetical protein